MDDLISRQAAIDALDKRFDSIPIEQTTEILLLRKDLRDLPTAEPQRTGEWIFNPKDAIELMFTKPKCSECGFESSDGGNYCPNCGARMEK